MFIVILIRRWGTSAVRTTVATVVTTISTAAACFVITIASFWREIPAVVSSIAATTLSTAATAIATTVFTFIIIAIDFHIRMSFRPAVFFFGDIWLCRTRDWFEILIQLFRIQAVSVGALGGASFVGGAKGLPIFIRTWASRGRCCACDHRISSSWWSAFPRSLSRGRVGRPVTVRGGTSAMGRTARFPSPLRWDVRRSWAAGTRACTGLAVPTSEIWIGHVSLGGEATHCLVAEIVGAPPIGRETQVRVSEGDCGFALRTVIGWKRVAPLGVAHGSRRTAIFLFPVPWEEAIGSFKNGSAAALFCFSSSLCLRKTWHWYCADAYKLLK